MNQVRLTNGAVGVRIQTNNFLITLSFALLVWSIWHTVVVFQLYRISEAKSTCVLEYCIKKVLPLLKKIVKH